jgi:NAD(P)-dependent dehydrogenase (short-subunit alcohol dehydrogenase family)
MNKLFDFNGKRALVTSGSRGLKEAGTAIFLASNASRYVHGYMLVMDGEVASA